jgi:hypothetical protein
MANGTIAFDTLSTSDSANTGTTKSIDTSYVFNGVAKFWLYANSAASLQDSFNIASGTDNGTGDYTYAITNDMVNDLYSGGANNNTSGNNLLNVRAIATGTIQVNSHVADSGSAADNNNFVQGHGDLA